MQANALPEFQYPAPTIIVQPIEIYRFRYIIDLKDHFVPLVGGDDPTGPKICVTVNYDSQLKDNIHQGFYFKGTCCNK